MATEILSEAEYMEMRNLPQALDSEVKSYLAAANALILNQLNWSVSEEGTEFLEVFNRRDRYFINNLQATKISKFHIITDPSNNMADRCHILDSGRLYISPPVPSGMYKITYDADTIEWAQDLKLAVALTVEYWEKHEYRNSRSFGGENITFMNQITGLPKHIMTIVNSHRII
ncbi:hypothetical protein [Providencia phage PSTCR5]|uniref:Head completion protein n=1 Tax=Providencia phage PSTCR5 TaxID=2783547 RepID=A0A873WQ62_9CAUD|nr:hypothetical protein KNV68_gp037 [Providencia phage PSTCR5]QPB12135.1 hypothetical protein [Providencia phage PSTCR5]